MKKSILLSVLLFLFSLAGTAFGQQVIRGTVRDESGEALPGANILLKGTQTATAAGVDGTFVLQLPDAPPPYLIQVSFVGYKTAEIRVVKAGENQTIVLESASELDELVVIGYGKIGRAS